MSEIVISGEEAQRRFEQRLLGTELAEAPYAGYALSQGARITKYQRGVWRPLTTEFSQARLRHTVIHDTFSGEKLSDITSFKIGEVLLGGALLRAVVLDNVTREIRTVERIAPGNGKTTETFREEGKISDEVFTQAMKDEEKLGLNAVANPDIFDELTFGEWKLLPLTAA